MKIEQVSHRDTDLSEKDWQHIKPLLPRKKRIGRGRADDRRTINGILFVLKTGCRWRDMPGDYGCPSTCWLRLIRWQEQGVWKRVLRVLLGQLGKRGRLKLSHGIKTPVSRPQKGGPQCRSRRSAKARSGKSSSTETARR